MYVVIFFIRIIIIIEVNTMGKISIVISFLIAIMLFFLPAAESTQIERDAEKCFVKEILRKNTTPLQLADWIIKGNIDYQLIDIRTVKEYEKENIENSENIPVDKLLTNACIENDLSEDKLIVLYSKDTREAFDASIILYSMGTYNVTVLEGGFNSWNKIIMDPVKLSDEATDSEILAYSRSNSIANRFGGGVFEDGATVVKKKKKPKTKKKKGKKKKKKLGGC